MKLSNRIFAFLLCAVVLLSLASCAKGGEEVPEGMQIASCAGAEYRLYVPTSWVVNTSYGVSGAYRTIGEQSTVSVVSYPVSDYTARMTEGEIDIANSGARIAWFWENECRTAVSHQALNGEISLIEEGCISTSLGGANAKQYRYSALINGERLDFLQIVAEREEKFYVFSMTANERMLETCLTDVSKMLETFLFADPYEPESAKIIDATDAPEGMQPASGEDVAYCLYIPNDWKIRYDQSIYSGYVEADGTSVSVLPYMHNIGSISVAQYFAMSEAQMKRIAGEDGYRLVATTEGVTLGGRAATDYEFYFRVGGVDYHYRQVIAAYRGMIYCVTYTATEAAYGEHLAEFEAILSAFTFR